MIEDALDFLPELYLMCIRRCCQEWRNLFLQIRIDRIVGAIFRKVRDMAFLRQQPAEQRHIVHILWINLLWASLSHHSNHLFCYSL